MTKKLKNKLMIGALLASTASPIIASDQITTTTTTAATTSTSTTTTTTTTTTSIAVERPVVPCPIPPERLQQQPEPRVLPDPEVVHKENKMKIQELTKLPVELLVTKDPMDAATWKSIVESVYIGSIPEYYANKIDLSFLNLSEEMSFEGYSPEELFAILRLTKNNTIKVNVYAYINAKAHSDDEADAVHLLSYQNLLGFMYSHGEGTETNEEMSELYYNMAAQGDFPVSLSNYYAAFQRKFSKEEDLADFAELNPFKCLERAVEIKGVIASYHMAELLIVSAYNEHALKNRSSIDRKRKEFYDLYMDYLLKEEPKQNEIEDDKGKGKDKKKDKGKKKLKETNKIPNHMDPVALYRFAAENGCVIAQHRLFEVLMNGIGCEKNIEEALIWGHKAADNGWIEAQNALASYYYDGTDFMDSNYELALKYAYHVAKRGGAQAQFILGNLYNMGLVVSEDNVKARKWYSKAARQGHQEAKDFLRQWDSGKDKDKDNSSENYNLKELLDFESKFNPLRLSLMTEMPSLHIGHESELNIMGESKAESALIAPDMEECILVLAFLNKNLEVEQNMDRQRAFIWIMLEFFDFVVEKKIENEPVFEKTREFLNEESIKSFPRVINVDHILAVARLLGECLEHLVMSGRGSEYLRKMLIELYRRAGHAGSPIGTEMWVQYVTTG